MKLSLPRIGKKLLLLLAFFLAGLLFFLLMIYLFFFINFRRRYKDLITTQKLSFSEQLASGYLYLRSQLILKGLPPAPLPAGRGVIFSKPPFTIEKDKSEGEEVFQYSFLGKVNLPVREKLFDWYQISLTLPLGGVVPIEAGGENLAPEWKEDFLEKRGCLAELKHLAFCRGGYCRIPLSLKCLQVGDMVRVYWRLVADSSKYPPDGASIVELLKGVRPSKIRIESSKI